MRDFFVVFFIASIVEVHDDEADGYNRLLSERVSLV